VEDWREDLRTLYVACTRAEDYLVLSAALPRGDNPANTWMLKLAERFDLRDGRCLDPDIPPERRPQVRVTDTLPPAPQVERPRAAGPGSAAALPLLPAMPCRHAAPMGDPILVLSAGAVQPTAVYHFDAEDGSDRTEWARPGEFSVEQDDSEESQRDRIIRSVLERWDMRDPEGWRPLLSQAIAVPAQQFKGTGLYAVLESLLDRFAQSEFFRGLSAARIRRHHVEFVVRLPSELDQASHSTPRGIQGVIDCLWQDPQGDWHVVAWQTSRGVLDRLQSWRRWKPILVLWTAAVEQSLGQRPKTINCYDLDAGILTTRPGPTAEAITSGLRKVLTGARDGPGRNPD
jgi:ATP-dependent exoDNAse (exonuclease V) beta subunit